MPDLLTALAFGSASTAAAAVVYLLALAYRGWIARLAAQDRGGR